MDIRYQIILFRVADVIISLAAIFLLLDAVLGFTGPHKTHSPQSRPASSNIYPTSVSASCTGGFSNERTVNGVTQVALHGTPFNAYQVTLTNVGSTAITIHSVTVALVNSQHKVFAQQHASLGNGAGITLGLGQSRHIVEASGINHPVASCQVLSWHF